jgi:hypothetical protein
MSPLQSFVTSNVEAAVSHSDEILEKATLVENLCISSKLNDENVGRTASVSHESTSGRCFTTTVDAHETLFGDSGNEQSGCGQTNWDVDLPNADQDVRVPSITAVETRATVDPSQEFVSSTPIINDGEIILQRPETKRGHQLDFGIFDDDGLLDYDPDANMPTNDVYQYNERGAGRHPTWV